MKKCRYCAEENQDRAVECEFCGGDLATEPISFPRSVSIQSLQKKSSLEIHAIVLILIFLVVVGMVFFYVEMVGH